MLLPPRSLACWPRKGSRHAPAPPLSSMLAAEGFQARPCPPALQDCSLGPHVLACDFGLLDGPGIDRVGVFCVRTRGLGYPA